jgi:hypothetical protein
MNKRDRLLLLGFGALVALIVVFQGYKKYQNALADQRTEIRRQEGRLASVQLEQRQAKEGQDKWVKLGAQTFAMDENQARGRFRDELHELVRVAGLTHPDVTLNSSMAWLKNGIRILPCTVQADGSLANMVRFFFELHREPYVARCKSLSIQQVADKKRPGVLKLTATIETLILPANKKVPTITPVELEKGKRKPIERSLFAKLTDYEVITLHNMMEPYTAPAPVAVAVSQPAQGPVVHAPPPPPPPPPPPADANKILARVLSSPRGQQAILQDAGAGASPTAQDTRVVVGETLYGGTLVFVHPRGVVSEKDGALRFHAVGSALQANQPLTEKDQPDVYYELKKLQARSEGIRVSPG